MAVGLVPPPTAIHGLALRVKGRLLGWTSFCEAFLLVHQRPRCAARRQIGCLRTALLATQKPTASGKRKSFAKMGFLAFSS
jgi:hypothetical protein